MTGRKTRQNPKENGIIGNYKQKGNAEEIPKKMENVNKKETSRKSQRKWKIWTKRKPQENPKENRKYEQKGNLEKIPKEVENINKNGNLE